MDTGILLIIFSGGIILRKILLNTLTILIVVIFRNFLAFGNDDLSNNSTNMAKNITETCDEVINSMTVNSIKYTKMTTNIYQEPKKDSIIFGELSFNTKVNVIMELDEWSCIALDNGMYTYIPSECLSDAPISNRWGIMLTDEEINLLYRIVMLESGGEIPLGQQAVTEVILNRIVNPNFPNSLEGVLSEHKQFAVWKNRNSANGNPTMQVIISVQQVLSGETNILPFNTVYFARRALNGRIQTKIGRHIFCNQ